ncbi:Crp/Fnr family transcriptional regulator [Dyadobacter sp. NIV53]|uniref:Crp/Fnr family transcriptional regulator n=1 Tax=Dyadobacter sp. NIV53 TaxID=2861765 RepID=UPI001C88A23A|nr:Crp/Fnr family transcriptional regulator [Dyadobacter sp. NIV53]
MEDFASIIKNVSRYIDFTEEEKGFFISQLRIIKVKKKQFVEQPGFVSNYRNYIVKGAMRAYVIGDDGQEHTISLAIEDWYICDLGSFILQEPGTLFTEAMEDCVLIQLSYEGEQLLLKNLPKFQNYLLVRGHQIAANMQKQILSNISQSAEQRYYQFAERYPQFLQRFPLYIIASYLGMTREFLSKIRNNKAHKNDA